MDRLSAQQSAPYANVLNIYIDDTERSTHSQNKLQLDYEAPQATQPISLHQLRVYKQHKRDGWLSIQNNDSVYALLTSFIDILWGV